jgi:PhzF family phenazine biosynthesis protein
MSGLPEHRHPYGIVDAFTAHPFSGNPAGVLILERDLPAEAMQTVAAEINLSETAFVHPRDAHGRRLIRWFTPTDEVPLCGHATLASARALLEEGEPFPLKLDSASGPLEVHREEDGRLRLDFPADPPVPEAPPPGMLDALGLEIPRDSASSPGIHGGSPAKAPYGPVPSCYRARNLWLIRLQSEEDVRQVSPDFTRLSRVDPGAGPLGVTVTAPGDDDGVDFVSRFFAPWVGVDEDPVTGIAHTVLTPYWAADLRLEEMEARQISRRGGALRVRMAADRVHLVGHAVVVARGEIRLPA